MCLIPDDQCQHVTENLESGVIRAGLPSHCHIHHVHVHVFVCIVVNILIVVILTVLVIIVVVIVVVAVDIIYNIPSYSYSQHSTSQKCPYIET